MRAQSTMALCPASLFWLGISFPTTPSQLGRIQSTDTNFGNSYNEEKKAFLFGMAHSRAGQGRAGRARLGSVPGSHPERVTNAQRCLGNRWDKHCCLQVLLQNSMAQPSVRNKKALKEKQ